MAVQVIETPPMGRAMDVFSHRDTVVGECKQFGTSFTTAIADDILDQVERIYPEMAEAIRTGRPYQTRLAPPPADPMVAHPPRGRVRPGKGG